MGRMFLFGNPVLREGFKHTVYTLQMSSLISFLAYLLTFCDTTLPLSVCVTSAIVSEFLYFILFPLYNMSYLNCLHVRLIRVYQKTNQSINQSHPISYRFGVIVSLLFKFLTLCVFEPPLWGLRGNVR